MHDFNSVKIVTTIMNGRGINRNTGKERVYLPIIKKKQNKNKTKLYNYILKAKCSQDTLSLESDGISR